MKKVKLVSLFLVYYTGGHHILFSQSSHSMADKSVSLCSRIETVDALDSLFQLLEETPWPDVEQNATADTSTGRHALLFL